MSRFALVLFVIGAGSLAGAQVLYDLSAPLAAPAFANLDPGVIMMDDILVPVSRLNGLPSVSITKIETQLYVALAGTYTITAWISKGKISGGLLQPEFPLTQLGQGTFTYANNNTIANITLGNGSTQLVSLPVLPFNFEGNDYGEFFFGLSFSAALQNIGWVLAQAPDTNLNGFWAHYGTGDPRNGPKALAGYRASFNVKVTGSPVPEPTSAVALGIGALAIVRRKRVRTSCLSSETDAKLR